ncbi:helix-turn-helix domain-containing protein [Frigoriglobus tundricola]|uniref:helix-turn-helix domain-containing protein n=1 Tax=Frigoriglobus tundricola TaxID=2774151 RepID=UPI00148E951A
MPTDRPALTVRDAAERFGVGPATVLAWIRAGELPAVNVSRSPRSKKPRWRVSEAALAAFEARRAGTPPPSARAPPAPTGRRHRVLQVNPETPGRRCAHHTAPRRNPQSPTRASPCTTSRTAAPIPTPRPPLPVPI